nr:unnamed protein product [Digitaria exilis]
MLRADVGHLVLWLGLGLASYTRRRACVWSRGTSMAARHQLAMYLSFNTFAGMERQHPLFDSWSVPSLPSPTSASPAADDMTNEDMALPIGHHAERVLHPVATVITVDNKLALAEGEELLFHPEQNRFHIRLQINLQQQLRWDHQGQGPLSYLDMTMDLDPDDPTSAAVAVQVAAPAHVATTAPPPTTITSQQLLSNGAASANAALAAALLAAQLEAAATQEALTWECERVSSFRAPPAGFGFRPAATDPMTPPPYPSTPPATSLPDAPTPRPSRGGGRRGRRRRRAGRGGGSGVDRRGTPPPAPSALGVALWPSFSDPWSGCTSMWPFQARGRGGGLALSTRHRPCSLVLPPLALACRSGRHPLRPASLRSGLGDGSFSTLGLTPPTSAEWITDSGASFHTTPDSGILSSVHPPHPSCPSSIMMIHNLLSIRQFTTDNSCSSYHKGFGIPVTGSLYTLRLPASSAPSSSSSIPTAFATTSSTTWHRRLGHPGRDALARLSRTPDEHLCHACQLGRHVRLPFSSSSSHASHAFDLIHFDLFTSPILSISSYKYYLVVVDDFSRYSWTFPLRAKSNAFPTLLHFFAWVSTQFGRTVKVVQCDNGREFDNHLSCLLSLSGHSAAHVLAERMIRTTNDVIRTLLIQASLPARFWAEALHTATYLLNRLPSTAISAPTPHHAPFGTPPCYDHLRVFGCACYPNTSATAPHKLAPRSTRCLDFPYSTSSTPSPDPELESLFPTNSVVQPPVSVYPFSAGSPDTVAPLPVTSVVPWAAPPPPTMPRAAPVPLTAPRAAPEPPVALRAAPESPGAPSAAPEPPTAPRAALTPSVVPRAAPEPLPAPPVPLGFPARSWQPVHVYRRQVVPAPMPAPLPASPPPLTPPASSPPPPPPLEPPVRPRIRSRVDPGVYHPPVVHRDPGHSHPMVTRRTASILRPVTLSATEGEPGISPIPSSVRDALADPNWRRAMEEEYAALLANQTWDLVPRPSGGNVVTSKWIWTHKRRADGSLERYKARWVLRGLTQCPGVDYDETFSPVVKPATVRTLDVKNAFLHGILSENVYCSQPAGFADSGRPEMTAYLLLYVDDIILTASSQTLLQRIIQSLQQEFAMKDLGTLHHFLGVTVEPHSSGLFLHQRQYALDILERAEMTNCKPCSTPVDTQAKLSADGGAPLADPTAYRSLAGALQYLTFTRPDITYAIQQRLLRYVRGTVDYGLVLHRSPSTELVVYTDADWAGCPDTRRSTSGYAVFLGGNLVSWSSKRQPVVSRSSAEAEYRAVANGLLTELYSPLLKSTLVYCDNVSAMYLSTNPVQHQRTKHLLSATFGYFMSQPRPQNQSSKDYYLGKPMHFLPDTSVTVRCSPIWPHARMA